MKLSGLISIYNGDNNDLLDRALGSIKNQNHSLDELVLIVDGAISDEKEIILENFLGEFKGECIISRNDKNMGLGYSLNKGLRICNNELIFRFDSDDISKPERTEKQVECYKKNEADIIGTYIIEKDLLKNKIKHYNTYPTDSESIYNYCKKRSPFHHGTIMYKKSSVLKVGAYSDLRRSQDYHLWFRMLKDGYKGMNIPEYLVEVNTGEDFMDKRGGLGYFKYDFIVQRDMFKYGFINIYRFISNTLIRFSVRVIPGKMRKYFYKNVLRKK